MVPRCFFADTGNRKTIGQPGYDPDSLVSTLNAGGSKTYQLSDSRASFWSRRSPFGSARFQGLPRSLEADLSWQVCVLSRRFRHDTTDQIVHKEVCPDLLDDKFQ